MARFAICLLLAFVLSVVVSGEEWTNESDVASSDESFDELDSDSSSDESVEDEMSRFSARCKISENRNQKGVIECAKTKYVAEEENMVSWMRRLAVYGDKTNSERGYEDCLKNKISGSAIHKVWQGSGKYKYRVNMDGKRLFSFIVDKSSVSKALPDMCNDVNGFRDATKAFFDATLQIGFDDPYQDCMIVGGQCMASSKCDVSGNGHFVRRGLCPGSTTCCVDRASPYAVWKKSKPRWSVCREQARKVGPDGAPCILTSDVSKIPKNDKRNFYTHCMCVRGKVPGWGRIYATMGRHANDPELRGQMRYEVVSYNKPRQKYFIDVNQHIEKLFLEMLAQQGRLGSTLRTLFFKARAGVYNWDSLWASYLGTVPPSTLLTSTSALTYTDACPKALYSALRSQSIYKTLVNFKHRFDYGDTRDYKVRPKGDFVGVSTAGITMCAFTQSFVGRLFSPQGPSDGKNWPVFDRAMQVKGGNCYSVQNCNERSETVNGVKLIGGTGAGMLAARLKASTTPVYVVADLDTDDMGMGHAFAMVKPNGSSWKGYRFMSFIVRYSLRSYMENNNGGRVDLRKYLQLLGELENSSKWTRSVFKKYEKAFSVEWKCPKKCSGSPAKMKLKWAVIPMDDESCKKNYAKMKREATDMLGRFDNDLPRKEYTSRQYAMMTKMALFGALQNRD